LQSKPDAPGTGGRTAGTVGDGDAMRRE